MRTRLFPSPPGTTRPRTTRPSTTSHAPMHATALKLLAIVLLALATSAMLAGCKRDSAADAPAGSTNATNAAETGGVSVDGGHVAEIGGDPASPDLGEFHVAALQLGSALDADRVVLADKDQFSPSDTLNASLLSTGAHPGLTLVARWVGPDGKAFAETTQELAPTQATATTFTVRNAEPWPSGDYKVDVLVGGHVLASRPFQVR
ncbi:hypothetical protein BH11PSE14_BH11PSE14_24080 [soil metagenome]